MNEPLEQDRVIGDALRAAGADGIDTPDWTRLRVGIGTRASVELARRRAQHRRRSLIVGVGLAAGLLLFLGTFRMPEPAVTERAGLGNGTPISRQVPTDELLDARVSDAEFRAWLSGAANADELLMIAAGEERP